MVFGRPGLMLHRNCSNSIRENRSLSQVRLRHVQRSDVAESVGGSQGSASKGRSPPLCGGSYHAEDCRHGEERGGDSEHYGRINAYWNVRSQKIVLNGAGQA